MTGILTQPPSLRGPLRFIRYAFMPNQLRYCGGDDNRLLFEYGVEQVVEDDLSPMLRKFTGAYPYLDLIARANDIADPFDERVVEAYWIGNDLLQMVEVRQLYDSLAERFGKQLQGRTRDWVLSKAPAGARPHHNFHVFDVHSKVGELEHGMTTMDQCRVSWGKVSAVHGAELLVDRQPLILSDGKLQLGQPLQEPIGRQVDGRGFVDDVQPGDWISVHWSWACEVISERQKANLVHYTNFHLTLANQTI